MKETRLRSDPDIAVALRRSARARRMTLRVSRLDGRVTLTLPQGVREAEALAFAEARVDWIRRHRADGAQPVLVGIGAALPVLGEMYRIVPGSGRRVVMAEGEIRVPGAAERVGARVQAWLKALARSELAFASDRYAEALGRSYTRLSLRDTRSRWGSCSSTGTLSYSWRLIMAPAEVLAYVAAHEVAHLKELNHSPAFWAEVERLYGDPRAAKKWLREEGHRLHGFQFSA